MVTEGNTKTSYIEWRHPVLQEKRANHDVAAPTCAVYQGYRCRTPVCQGISDLPAKVIFAGGASVAVLAHHASVSGCLILGR
jgi:hypothetical protein